MRVLTLGSAVALAAAALLLAAIGVISRSGIVGANPHPGQSVDVVVCCGDGLGEAADVTNGGELPVTGSAGELGDFVFASILAADVNGANLAAYDTLVLNVASDELDCNVDQLSDPAKADIVSFVGGGHKLIIYDSECSPQNYSWLPFPFTTNNPGAQGAEGTVNIVEENTLSSTAAADAHYIDAVALGQNTDAIGDMNVMVTRDPNWCLDMSGTNVNQVTGPVHAYARYGTVGTVGLMIYDGMDVDDMGDESPDWLRKVWVQQLQQPFNPDNLPCSVPVAGIRLDPETATNDVQTTHTVTATVTDLFGQGTPDVEVTFEVTAGPNAGDSGNGVTDTEGMTPFTYTGDGGVGTDTIEACFTPEIGAAETALQQAPEPVCDTAMKEWVQPTASPSPSPSPSPTALAATATPASLPASGGHAGSADGTPVGAWVLVWVGAAAALIGAGVFMRRFA